MPVETNDAEALVDFFDHRLGAKDEAMRMYWAGRIDGHCLQNAITHSELCALAKREGFDVDWNTAMGAA